MCTWPEMELDGFAVGDLEAAGLEGEAVFADIDDVDTGDSQGEGK